MTTKTPNRADASARASLPAARGGHLLVIFVSSMSQAPPARVLFLCTGNYYRSRFAEIMFNHMARARGAAHVADSAGLSEECWRRNRGPLSPHTLAALAARGVDPGELRPPRDVCLTDFTSYTLVIAMKDEEHRPMMRARFPQFADRIVYWAFDDVQDQPPDVILPQIENHVSDLLKQLG